jgi:hypothetical protein
VTLPLSDRPAKLERLLEILERRDAASLTLTSCEALAWLFDGARVTVPYVAQPVLAAVVHRSGEIDVTAFANEVDRLAGEEIPDVTIRPIPWHGSLTDPDSTSLREADALADVRAARATLLPLERSRYGAFGAELAAAVTDVLATVDPRDTERAVAARLVGAVVALGADPIVTLVAGAARLELRHPLPTTGVLGDRAMIVVGARRHGLIANLTRWVCVDPITTAAEAAILEVEADALAATRPGRELRDVLGDIAASYERHGFGQHAWLDHHQGGPTGYAGRDPRATPDARELVAAGQAFAWNPSGPGVKVEDTVIVDADRVVVLTADPRWPTVTVGDLERPLPLTYTGVAP